ncbi:MAG: serine/threonine-protein phosphatase [Alphaproteobacteria bacterium]|nr:serine/threonine-protein phosphatase [Alphaproteobacteria bacterium]
MGSRERALLARSVDREAWLVYADSLLEAGSPHGERLVRILTAADDGALARGSDVVRGAEALCFALLRADEPVDLRLALYGHAVVQSVEEAREAVSAGLRSLHVVGWDVLHAMAAEALPVERIWPLELTDDISRALATLGALPRLEALALVARRGWDAWQALHPLLACETRLAVVRVHEGREPDVPTRLAVERHPTLERLEWRTGSLPEGLPATLPALPTPDVQRAPRGAVQDGCVRIAPLAHLAPTAWLAWDTAAGALATVSAPLSARGHPAPPPISRALQPLGPMPWSASLSERVRHHLGEQEVPPGRTLGPDALEHVLADGEGLVSLGGTTHPIAERRREALHRMLTPVDTAFRWAAHTTRGPVRAYNEDAWLAAGDVFAVVDGMGGHMGGDLAAFAILEGLAGPGDLRMRLLAAHAALQGLRETPAHGSGGTVVALDLGASELAWAGDCRAYRVRDGRPSRLSRDHSLMEDLVAAGEATPGDVFHHRYANIVTRALTEGSPPEIEGVPLDVRPGDRYLLVSDGIWRLLDDPTLAALLLEEPDPHGCVARLVAEACRCGGTDNATALVVEA